MTCGALVCDFSVDSVVVEGPSRLRYQVAERGMLTWRTDLGAGSIRVRAMCSYGQGSQLILSRNHPTQEPQTRNRRVTKGKGVRCLVQGRVDSINPVSFPCCFKEAWSMLDCTCEDGRGFNP